MSQNYKLPEVPSVLSEEQMQSMSIAELREEKERRFQIMIMMDERCKLISHAWHSVYVICEAREYRDRMRAEIMKELQASLPPQPQPESAIQNETTPQP